MNIPLGRCGSPEEIADAAVFLASDKARRTTGVAVELDGGAPHRHRRYWAGCGRSLKASEHAGSPRSRVRADPARARLRAAPPKDVVDRFQRAAVSSIFSVSATR
ncbi:SDR family oxidoreductase [Nocardia higoensis]|uniref:SDR family oxidoreductase n=1 Tax=Nocardia higoensis TaxID=228599 RepID=UPI002B4B7EA2|nr:SDR family oxidoreductase [Nocardia higoensis]